MAIKLKLPSAVVFHELRKIIPSIPPSCRWLVLKLDVAECTYECGVYVKEDDVADQAQDTPNSTTTQAVAP